MPFANSPGSVFTNTAATLKMGADVWLNFPQRHNIRVETVKHEPDQLLSVTVQDGNPSILSRRRVVANLWGDVPVIDAERSDKGLLGARKHYGTAEKYLMFGSLFYSPVIAAIGTWHKVMEHGVWGHSRHHQALLEALDGQLSAEHMEIFRQATQNTWQGLSSPPVSLSDAEEILAGSRRLVEKMGRRTLYNWMSPEGLILATGSTVNGIRGEPTVHHVQIFDTRFEGETAQRLMKVFASTGEGVPSTPGVHYFEVKL